MRKYQLKLVTMYIAHSAQTFRLVKMAPTGRRRGRPAGSGRTRSASLLGRVGRRVLARAVAEPRKKHQAPDAGRPGEEPEGLAPVKPPSSTSRTQTNGVSPPMNRAASQTAPWANPRSVRREPVVQGPRHVRERPGLAHPEQELHPDQHAEPDDDDSEPGRPARRTRSAPTKKRPPQDDPQQRLARPVRVAHPPGRDLEAGVGELEGDQDPEEVGLRRGRRPPSCPSWRCRTWPGRGT